MSLRIGDLKKNCCESRLEAGLKGKLAWRMILESDTFKNVLA